MILANGMLQHYGLVNEFYGPQGNPNPHNLCPFETGWVLEALARFADEQAEGAKGPIEAKP